MCLSQTSLATGVKVLLEEKQRLESLDESTLDIESKIEVLKRVLQQGESFYPMFREFDWILSNVFLILTLKN